MSRRTREHARGLWAISPLVRSRCLETGIYHCATGISDLSVGMTDSAPVFRFSDLVGLTRPSRPKQRANVKLKPLWRKDIAGLRAFRVLHEIQPFLAGERLRGAQKALTFFSPMGYHRGWFRPIDVWPPNEFPLRGRRGRYLFKSTETV